MGLFSGLLPAIGLGLVAGMAAQLAIRTRRERSAWGAERANLSFQDRREIRTAVRAGRAVADPRLARPAVRLGDELAAEFTRTPDWLRRPPPWFWKVCLVLFAVLGAALAVDGVIGGSVDDIVVGALCFMLAGLYLPAVRRWSLNRQARRQARVQNSIMANRMLGEQA